MRQQLDLNQVRTFVAVVQQGGFSAAGRALGLPTSNVSRHVSQLEAYLGVRLLERSTRHLRITEPGQRLLGSARGWIDELAQIEDELRGDQQQFRGLLRVSLPGEFGPRVLGDAVVRFSLAHPNLQLDCQARMAGPHPASDDFDLAISFQRGQAEASDMVTQSLFKLDSVVLAAPALLKRCGTPRKLSELAHWPCISTATALNAQPWVFIDEAGREYAVPVDARFRADSAELARKAAVQGVGATILPLLTCQEEIATGLLVPLALDGRPAPLQLVASFPHRRHVARKTRALLDELVDSLRQRGWGS